MEEMKQSEYEALVSLLEDEDQEIIQHIENKILSLGTPVIPFLESEWEKNFNPAVQRRIEDLIHVLQYDQLKERLMAWKRNGHQDLLEGMWLVATYQYPDLELEKLRQDLEQLYIEVWTDFRDDLQPLDQVKVINGAIFNKLKFGANTKNFHSPGNSMINVVLETRRGNPISLCVIYILIAQKLGVPIYGVNLPNLFIITFKDEDVQFYINAFNRGLVFSKEDIDNYIGHLHLAPHHMYYQPCSNHEIVKRVLRNLIMSFEKLDEHQKAEEVKVLLTAMAEGDDYNEVLD